MQPIDKVKTLFHSAEHHHDATQQAAQGQSCWLEDDVQQPMTCNVHGKSQGEMANIPVPD